MKIKDIPLENRPRERMKNLGVEVLSDAELLALILQKGTAKENVVDMSNRLISSVDKLNDCSLAELMQVHGVGEAKAMQILACFELVKRNDSGRICEKVISSPSDIAKYYMEKLKDKKKEYFIAVFLDSKNKIIKDEVISIGTLNSSLVHPREVFKAAIKNSANSIILVHNHPSGDCEASANDWKIHKILSEGGELINIKIVDNVITGKKSYFSVTSNKIFHL